jgi:ADP-heptose:LPS heptosyltransferase
MLSMGDLIISGNNGIMHIAAALHRPQIELHGPTDSVKWGPLNSRRCRKVFLSWMPMS